MNMNELYTKEELKKKLSISKIISWSLFLLILSPAPFAALTAYRCFSMQTINIIGICWAMITGISGIALMICGILGIIKFRTLIKSEIQISGETFKWLRKKQKNAFRNLFIAVSISIFLFAAGIVSAMTTSGLYRSDNPYVLAGYAGVFVCFGTGICLILNSVLMFFMLRSIKCSEAEENAEFEKTDRKKSKFKFIIVPLVIFVVLILLMFKGTWYIQPYISTIPSVPHRQIPVSYDKDSGVYTMENPENGDFKILQLTDIHIGGSTLAWKIPWTEESGGLQSMGS